MKFTTYIKNKPTGTHECPDWEVNTVSQGQSYVEGHALENQYILNGRFVDFPARPSLSHIWDWDSLSWKVNQELAENLALQKRKELLSESDWTQLSDISVNKTLWAEYRQSLRDITKQSGYPFEIIWPEKPR